MSVFITITGQKHYFGLLPFSVGNEVVLKPDPENLYDHTAISVYAPPYGKAGNVAKQEATRAEGTVSATEIFPHIKDNTRAIIRFIAGEYIIAEIME